METTLESPGDAAVLSEENGYIEPAVNHLDMDGGSAQQPLMNGLSNGYDKEKKEKERHKDTDKHDKDKYRDKEKRKDGDRDKHRSKDGDKEKHRDKDKSKDRDREKEKHRDKDKERDKDKDKERDKEKDKDREKNKEKDKERDKDRDKSKHSSSSSSKDKHSSSSSSKDKDKERKDRDREKEKSKHHDDKERKDKEHKSSSSSTSKDKEHKSSSSSKHSSSSSSKPSSESSSKDKDKEKDKERDKNRDKEKDKERSKDKHSSSSSKDKDRHSSDKHKSDKEKEKDKHSSSSSKDKDRHSSEKKDKHKEKDREKGRSKDKEKEKSKEKEKEKDKSATDDSTLETSHIKSETSEVKEFSESFSFQTSIKEESMDMDDDDGKLMIKEEPTDDESKMESSFDMSAVKDESSIKREEEDDDDVPMAARMAKMKREVESDDEDDMPLMARKKVKKEGSAKKRKKQESDYDDDDEEDFKPVKKKKKQPPQQVKKEKKQPAKVKQESITESPKKKKKKEEEEQEVWKWWEEEKKPDGVKWTFLEHKGPIFAPAYEPLPPNVKFYYDDKEMKLSEPAEEVASFYARMLDHDYTTKEAFNKNFMHDWRKVMTRQEQETITSLRKCNFKHMHAYFIKLSEERKAMSKEEKKAIKEKNDELQKEYGFCSIDGHKEKIGNFRIEPPGLFRGRGEHPKMGKLKQRVMAEDIIINCSKDSKVPPPPPGHKWKEVRHDNSVTWLASWTENVQGQVKYIMLNPSSKLKGEKDWQKYETARKLAKSIDKIREDYTADWKSKEMKIRQRAVAMYFIDKLALRAGNEKDEDQADTVGCCSLRVEHIQLFEEKDGKENVVVFDFLGKDSIRYYNEVPVERRVFKNLMLFMENKKPQDDLFDRLNTSVLNKHLSDLMEGLTAKVFRTYNASWTLQAQLKELTDPDSSVAEKLLAYNRANRAVAILCNHQRAVPKTHDKSMANLREKLANKRAAVEEAEKSFKHAKRDAKNGSAKERIAADKAKKTLERLRDQLLKLELQETDREENKCIALGTSKLNYLDPRISVAWCKKFEVPIEKIYNKTQRDKFRWAIDMATADYVF